MTAAILQFPREKIVRIAPLNYPPQVRIEMARRVEHAFGSDAELIDKWAAAVSVLHGSTELPSDVEEIA